MTFRAAVETDPKHRVFLPLPFDPDAVWGRKVSHHVAGTVDGVRIRAVVEPLGPGVGIVLPSAWRRDCGLTLADDVEVFLVPEGPQRADLAEDISAALEAEPSAAIFFDSLAQFYRKGYLRWIDGTKRRPDLRTARIAEMVDLLKAGCKERPRGKS